MKYDQKLKNEYYATTANAYARIDSTPFIKSTFQEMLQLPYKGKPVLDYLQGKHILDLGCGTGRLFFYLKKSYVVGVDVSKEMLHHARKRMSLYKLKGKLVQSDLFQFRTTQTFDAAISIGVLGEHIPFTRALALNVFHRLKEKGVFMFTIVPLKKRWLQVSLKHLLQWTLLFPLPNRLKNAALMGYFAHSRRHVESILKSVGFKEVQCSTVLKGHFEHYEFITRKP